MRRNEEDDKLIASGELWETFKNTLYYEELDKFCKKTIRDFKDMIVDASMNSRHDEARDLAQKLAGFRMVTDWIDDTISTRAESLEFEREQKDFERQLPHRL